MCALELKDNTVVVSLLLKVPVNADMYKQALEDDATAGFLCEMIGKEAEKHAKKALNNEWS